jgi:YD repeat-containing protein
MIDSFVRRNTADSDKRLDAERFERDGDDYFRPRTTAIYETYSKRMDYDGSGNLIYYGKALPGALVSDPAWSIQKITYDGSGNVVGVGWAEGNKDFTHVWNARATISYS